MKLYKIILLGLAIFIFGCGGAPATQYYVLHLSATPAANSTQISVGISNFGIEPIFSNYKIAYRESPYQIQFYHYHQWASDPAKIVQDGITDYLAQSGKFARVVRLPSHDQVDITVQGHIRKLEEWDETDRWYGVIEIDFNLIEKQNNRSVWKGSMSRKIPADQKDPLAIVRALSRATEEIAEELSQEIMAQSHIAEKAAKTN